LRDGAGERERIGVDGAGIDSKGGFSILMADSIFSSIMFLFVNSFSTAGVTDDVKSRNKIQIKNLCF